jgi:hypothetical protein
LRQEKAVYLQKPLVAYGQEIMRISESSVTWTLLRKTHSD